MKLQAAIISLFVISICGCNSLDSKIDRAFNSVNSSIEKSNSVSQKTVSDIQNRINTHQPRNHDLKGLADSLFAQLQSTVQLIDSIIRKIDYTNLSETDTLQISDIMVESAIGLEFEQKMNDLYRHAYHSTVDNLRRDSIRKVFSSVLDVSVESNWRKLYFGNQSGSAVVANLNKFKNDCYEVSRIALTDIENRLSN